MNFFTSSFRKTALILVLFFVSGMLVFFTVNFGLHGYVVQKRTSRTYFVDAIASKTQHMHLNLLQDTKSVILLGNSRTLNQYNTNILENAYNYGVSGVQITNFPHMVQQAKKHNPDAIVFTLSTADLAKEDLEINSNIALEDLREGLKSTKVPKDIASYLLAYFQSLNKLRFYAEGIYYRIENLYKKFNLGNITPENKEVIRRDNKDIQCDIASKNKVDVNRIVYKCTNGDSALDGVIQGNMTVKNIDGHFLHPVEINTLRSVFRNLESVGITPILAFVPDAVHTTNVDLTIWARKMFGVTVLDYTDVNFERTLWFDEGHLNIEGRDILSRMLQDDLKAYGL